MLGVKGYAEGSMMSCLQGASARESEPRPLEGKRLLVIGASHNEIDLVRRAQELGAYVVVTDNHEDWDDAPAKREADEAWNISWSDIDAMQAACETSRIDGATAGYSEFRCENLIKLCDRMGWPCYLTSEQLEITRDKVKFKETCRKYGVPTVEEWHSVNEVDSFPVIVKPVDRGGSIGISIATNSEELRAAYQYAMSMSVSKQVIIERFLQGQKMDVYYAIEDGEIRILTTNDAINASDNGFERVVQSAWLYPEKHMHALVEKEDEHMRAMIRGMGITNGCIFFSGFVGPAEEFSFFECGFRLEGGHQDEYVSHRGPYNFLDLFIYHALFGNVRLVERKEVDDRLKCVTVNFYAKAGTIGSISGMERVAELPDCTLARAFGRIGQECKDDRAILSKVAMASFANEDPTALKADIDECYRLFALRDTNGRDMVYDRIDTDAILDWWS